MRAARLTEVPSVSMSVVRTLFALVLLGLAARGALCSRRAGRPRSYVALHSLGAAGVIGGFVLRAPVATIVGFGLLLLATAVPAERAQRRSNGEGLRESNDRAVAAMDPMHRRVWDLRTGAATGRALTDRAVGRELQIPVREARRLYLEARSFHVRAIASSRP